MKLLLILILISLFVSCNPTVATKINMTSYTDSKAQIRLNEIIDKFNYDLMNAANDAVKHDLKDSFLLKIDRFLVDSLHNWLKNFRIKIDKIDIAEIGSDKDFVAYFYDAKPTKYPTVENAEYWMEFDYPMDKAGELTQNPSYKLLKSLPEGIDTTVNLLYMGKIDFKDASNYQPKIRVVPFPKTIDFDSAVKINASIQQRIKD